METTGTYNRRHFPRMVLIALLGLAGCSGAQPQANPDPDGSRFRPCPDSPNCVSSQTDSDRHHVAPLRYDGDLEIARKRLLAVLGGMERVKIVRADATYVHAEFRSALFAFVDDVEFRFDPHGVVQIRSASRVGYSDFGVNRKRVEDIRARFVQTAHPSGGQ